MAGRESFLLAFVAAAMIARTYCDLWMLKNGFVFPYLFLYLETFVFFRTSIEASIVARDPKGFKRGLTAFILAMLPISFVNQVMKYGLNELGLRFRTNLTNHLFKK